MCIRDRGHELDKMEIPIEGIIPAESGTMVGTLAPEKKDKDGVKRLLTNFTFNEMIGEDPELQLRFSEGIEVTMADGEFTNASIDVVELRAVPDDSAAKDVRGKK